MRFYTDAFMTLYRDPGIEKKCKFGTDRLMPCMQEEEKEEEIVHCTEDE